MKRIIITFVLTSILLSLSAAALFAENAPAAVSPEFSAASADIADFIIDAVKARRETRELTYLSFDPYTLNDLRTGFGVLLSSSVGAEAAEKGRGIVGIIATDYLPLLRRNNPDYQLPVADLLVAGKIFQLAEKLHIQTILIDPDRGIITATHDIALPITPEIFSLLSASTGGGLSDLYEPDGQDNPTLTEGEFRDHEHTLTPGDEDWYVYRSARNGLVSCGTEGNLDTVITAYGPDDTYTSIAYNDDAENSGNARVSIVTESGRTYYFQIQGYEGEESGPYTVYFTFEEFNDALEPNNTMADAVDFPAGQNRIETRFFPQNDTDWFKFTVPDGARSAIPIIIETHSGIDPEVTLYSSDGAVVGSSDDDGSDYNARLAVSVQSGESYYILVTEIDANTGEYALSITGLE